jgi:hypothetical protein
MYSSLREPRTASDKPPARAARRVLGAEEVDPKIPVHRDPQEALADADERGRLRNRVRREDLKLHTVVVARPRRKRLTGAVKPRSWKRVKLTM